MHYMQYSNVCSTVMYFKYAETETESWNIDVEQK